MAVTTVDESFGANVSVQLLGGSVGVDATGGTGAFPRDASSEFCSSSYLHLSFLQKGQFPIREKISPMIF